MQKVPQRYGCTSKQRVYHFTLNFTDDLIVIAQMHTKPVQKITEHFEIRGKEKSCDVRLRALLFGLLATGLFLLIIISRRYWMTQNKVSI